MWMLMGIVEQHQLLGGTILEFMYFKYLPLQVLY